MADTDDNISDNTTGGDRRKRVLEKLNRLNGGGVTQRMLDTRDEEDGYTSGMTQTEKENYKVLKSSPKNWSDDEAREMATNPSGRLGKYTPPSQNYRKDNSKNLGKFLHPKKGSVPADEANGTVDANTGGAKVRPSQ